MRKNKKEKVYCMECEFFKIGITIHDQCHKKEVCIPIDTPVQVIYINDPWELNKKNNCKHFLKKVKKAEPIKTKKSFLEKILGWY